MGPAVYEIVVARCRQLFRVGRIFQYRLRGDLHSLFRESESARDRRYRWVGRL